MDTAKQVRVFLEELGDFLQQETAPKDVVCKPPEELHIELTYRCDSNCIMCDLKYLEKKQKKKDLSIREVKRMVRGSEFLKDLKFIILSGGEPWLNDDFIEIIRFLYERYPKAKILILTNLFNTDLILSRIEEIKTSTGLDRICLGTSLDGLKDVHDHIRGRAGAFHALVQTGLVIRKKYPKLFPVFNFTMVPENSHQLFAVYNWARKMGFSVSFQVMVQKKETKVFKWTENNFRSSDEGINKIIESTWQERGWDSFSPGLLLDNLNVLFFLLNLHYIDKYIRNPGRFYLNCPCGEKYAMINPSGDIYFCPVHKDMIAGSIKERSFDDLWRSDGADEIRGFLNKKICHCWLSCTSSIMFTDVFFTNKKAVLSRFMPEIRNDK